MDAEQEFHCITEIIHWGHMWCNLNWLQKWKINQSHRTDYLSQRLINDICLILYTRDNDNIVSSFCSHVKHIWSPYTSGFFLCETYKRDSRDRHIRQLGILDCSDTDDCASLDIQVRKVGGQKFVTEERLTSFETDISECLEKK